VVTLLEQELRPLIAEMGEDGACTLRVRPSWGADPDPIIRASTIPVLVVPAAPLDSRAQPRPLTPIRSVLAATDLSDGSSAVVVEAYRLLRSSGGVVELCHFVGPRPEPLSPQRWTAVQEQLWALVPEEADSRGIVTRVSVLDGGSPDQSIVAAAERLGCDHVVLGSRGRPGLVRMTLGSVVDGVLQRAPCPVLVVRQSR
jgi:nucleotide-binding universal stress UspA family protein